MSLRVLLAPNSFKGTASASDVFRALQEGLYYFSNINSINVESRKLLVCDGGTGFSEIIGKTLPKSKRIDFAAADPLLREIEAYYYLSGDTAVIESAQTIGHARLSASELNPIHTSTYGLGLAIRHAISSGARHILLGCGDTATSDGGAGMLAALGVRFRDCDGKEIPKPTGGDLSRIAKADFSTTYDFAKDVSFEVACNLTSIAAGRNSTALVYSRQKGASEEEAQRLYTGISSYTALIGNQIGEPDLGLFPGSGAAGGVGFGLCAFSPKARLRYSFDVVFDRIRIDQHLNWAHLVITGEGLFDRNSVKGKAPVAVALRAKAFDVLTIGVVGGIQKNITSRVLRSGFDVIEPFSSEALSLDDYTRNFFDVARDATVRALEKARPLFPQI